MERQTERKRTFPRAFVSKCSNADPAETQVWIKLAGKCGHFNGDQVDEFDRLFETIQGRSVIMLTHPEQWRIG
jgi:hypothetical protein